MRLFSLVYRPDIDTYYLYDREGRRILPDKKKLPISSEDRYGFSFRDDFNSDKAVIWAQLLEEIELEAGMEYFRQAEMGSGKMRDIITGMSTYWLDRARVEGAAMPGLVEWSRTSMVDPQRHEKKISKFYTGAEAVAAVQTIFERYVELVKTREHQNYGNFWSNEDRINLLTLRIDGMMFKNIAKKMGRTNAACRAQYGRIRRGEDTIYLELTDWDSLREALPLGMFAKETTPE